MIVGVQLYAFQRDDILNDLDQILTKLRGIGYDAVEGLPGHDVDYSGTLDKLDMHYAAAHLGAAKLEDLGPIVSYLNKMGSSDICSSGPLNWKDATADDYRRTCEFLNRKGFELRELGIHLHYHNHEFEFLPIEDDLTGMDILLEDLHPDYVDLCFDAGWAWRAGVDPAEFMEDHGDVITYLHLRDFSGETSVPLGAGEVDLAAILSAVNRLPELRWLVVEHDPVSADPLADLTTSRKFLRNNFRI